MGNFNAGQLKKMQTIFEELSYEVRYGKGQFKAGYCILKDKKVVVVNRYYDVDGKMETLLEILDQIEEPKEILLSDKSMRYLKKLYQKVTELKG